VVNVETTKATGTAERDAAAAMLGEIEVRGQHITVGADKAYDTRGFVRACHEIDVTPHVAQNVTRRGGSAIDGRTTRHVGYANSQRKRKRTEQCFGWAKTVGPMCQVMLRGLDKVNHAFTLTMVAYNLTRLRNLADSAASRIRQERQTHRLPQCKDAMSSPVQVSTFDSTGGHCMTRPVLATVTRSAVQSSVFQRPDKPQGPLINLRNLFR